MVVFRLDLPWLHLNLLELVCTFVLIYGVKVELVTGDWEEKVGKGDSEGEERWGKGGELENYIYIYTIGRWVGNDILKVCHTTLSSNCIELDLMLFLWSLSEEKKALLSQVCNISQGLCYIFAINYNYYSPFLEYFLLLLRTLLNNITQLVYTHLTITGGDFLYCVILI